MGYQSVNSYDGKLVKKFEEISNSQLETALQAAATCVEAGEEGALKWRRTRSLMNKIANASFLVGIVLFGVAPASARADDTSKGKAIYAEHCVVCHGLHGKGNGPSGKTLDPKPTDFTTAAADDEFWFKVTKLGSKAVDSSKSDKMEAFGGKLSDPDIRNVVAYTKTFKVK